MNSRFTAGRFEALDSQLRIEKIHEEAMGEFLSFRSMRNELEDGLDWIPQSEWDKRHAHAQKHEYLTGELAAWLSQLDQNSISSNKVADKLTELENEGRRTNWNPWAEA